MTNYHSRAAQEAEATNYGNRTYWNYLEENAQRLHTYYAQRGNQTQAVNMLTRTLAEALPQHHRIPRPTR